MKKTVLVIYRHEVEVRPCVMALEAAGLLPRLEEAFPGVRLGDSAGLVLTGGSDVNPRIYGEAPVPETDEPDDLRDAVERQLVDETLAADLPLLGICRGLHLLNVHLGGSLIQHLPTSSDHVRYTPEHGLPAHVVEVKQDTLLSEIAGCERWQVNSRHHQAVNRPGRDLRVCATDPRDGVVEAVELPGRRFVLAVQWHPENQAPADAEQRKLFEAFARAL